MIEAHGFGDMVADTSNGNNLSSVSYAHMHTS